VSATTAFAFLVGLVALGNLLGRLRVLPAESSNVLNQVVLNVCLPAAILLYAPQLQFSVEIAAVAAVPWLLFALATALVFGVGHWLGWDVRTRWLLVLAIALGNTSFLGYPLSEALLGVEALPWAVVYDQFGTFVLMSTVGVAILARVSGGDVSAAAMARRVLGFPPFIALVVALTLMPDSYPLAITQILGTLAGALLPLVALAIGVSLRLRLPRDQVGPLAFGLAGKLLLLPLASWPLAWLLGIEGVAFDTVVLESAMPTMITAMVLASAAGLDSRLASALAGYGIVLSALSLPLWAWALQSF